MDRTILESSEAPTINIQKINGTLRIRGWDKDEIRIDSDGSEDVDYKQKGNTISLSCNSGCYLRIPSMAIVKIENALGDLRIKSFEGELEASLVGGQVFLKNVGPTHIQSISSHLSVRHCEGKLQVDSIGGNATIRDAEDQVILPKINGNFQFRGFSNFLNADAKGDSYLKIEPSVKQSINVVTGGNLSCKLLDEASGKVSLKSDTKTIKVTLEGETEKINELDYSFEISTGDGEINLQAGGQLAFVGFSDMDYFEEDFETEFEANFERGIDNFADEINMQVTDQIESQMENISDRISNITDQFSGSSKKAKNIQRKLNRKLAKAERSAERAQRRADHLSAMADRRAARYTGSRKTKSDPISDEERMKILEMVQNNQIAVSDAELLLSALEGKSPKKSPAAEVSPEEPQESSEQE